MKDKHLKLRIDMHVHTEKLNDGYTPLKKLSKWIQLKNLHSNAVTDNIFFN